MGGGGGERGDGDLGEGVAEDAEPEVRGAEGVPCIVRWSVCKGWGWWVRGGKDGANGDADGDADADDAPHWDTQWHSSMAKAQIPTLS